MHLEEHCPREPEFSPAFYSPLKFPVKVGIRFPLFCGEVENYKAACIVVCHYKYHWAPLPMELENGRIIEVVHSYHFTWGVCVCGCFPSTWGENTNTREKLVTEWRNKWVLWAKCCRSLGRWPGSAIAFSPASLPLKTFVPLKPPHRVAPDTCLQQKQVQQGAGGSCL
jgi:hypothetical protein